MSRPMATPRYHRTDGLLDLIGALLLFVVVPLLVGIVLLS